MRGWSTLYKDNSVFGLMLCLDSMIKQKIAYSNIYNDNLIYSCHSLRLIPALRSILCSKSTLILPR
jgi:hypothetical protein